MDKPCVVGLDIGTTKICAVVGQVSSNGIVDILGIGQSESTGLRKGMVVNIEQTTEAIRSAIKAAELMTNTHIHSVYVGIAGSHIFSQDSHGLIGISRGSTGGSIIEKADIERVLDAARPMMIPADREILHILPQEYIVDDQKGIINPVGMAGVKLEVSVHVVTGSTYSVRNIYSACTRSDVEVHGMCLESLASARAVLTDPERELGVALVDMGGGTTDIAIYINNAIRYTKVIEIGGQNVTNDIAYGLRTPLASAEEIKIHHACAMVDLVYTDEQIEVPSVGGVHPRRISKQLLAEICEPRMDEILSRVDGVLTESGLKNKLGAGIVLTGGTSRIEGCIELAEQIFQMPVRIGCPCKVGGLKDLVNKPQYATVVGLLLEADAVLPPLSTSAERPLKDEDEPGFLGRIFTMMKSWFTDIR